MQAEQLTDPVAYHAEGPVWWDGWGGLRWVDMLAGDLLSLGPDGAIGRRNVGRVAAAVRPRGGGGAVIGVENGFALEGPDGSLTYLEPLWTTDDIRMNEGGCDPDGRFYCGSMAYDRRVGAAALHRLDPDGAVEVVLDGLTISNGLDWSPDGAIAYYVDTDTRRVDVFDYGATQGLTGRRPFVTVEDGAGVPDGLTVDADGGVWVALNGGGAVRRYDPNGRLDDVVEVPVPQVTACALGGPHLDELFITTSRENLAPGDAPASGSLFHAHVGARGQLTKTFAG
jgi:sugar lactone lactonase YvrE